MTYDEEQIGRIVREVADGWTLPPVRLDQPGWRARLRRGPAVGAVSRRGSFRALAAAAGLAIVLVVTVAIVGVMLNTRVPIGPAAPRGSDVGVASPSGSSASPSGSHSSRTATPATPLPTDAPVTQGTPPSVTRAIVLDDQGSYALLNLATGKLGPPIQNRNSASHFWIDQQSGDLACVCVSYSAYQASQPTHVNVTYDRFNGNGALVSSKAIAQKDGAPDPRDPVTIPEEPADVRVAVSQAGQGTFAVGWSTRQHPAWKNGIILVDAATGATKASVDLPDTTDGDGNTRQSTDAPKVAGVAGDRLLIGRSWYTWSPPESNNPLMANGTDIFSVTWDGTTFGTPTAVDAGTCGDITLAGGATADGGTWVACGTGGTSVTLSRIAADGSFIGVSTAPTFDEIGGATVAVSRDGSKLYVWQPVTRTVTRIDTTTGVADDIQAPNPAAAAPDVLAQLGQWLIPSTSAKMFLHSGVALSPDGNTLYALGMTAFDSRDVAASTGVYAISLGDSMTVRTWTAAADFVSVAVSSDGNYVYAAGAPGVDSTGNATGQAASVTVYDAATGEITFRAGQLGLAMITFAEQTLP